MATSLALLQSAGSSGRLSLHRASSKARCPLQPLAACHSSSQPAVNDTAQVPQAAWAPIIAGASSLLIVSSAWAEEVEDVIIEADDGAQALSGVMAAVQQEQSGYDLVVSVMFTGVVASLSIVTLGVAYLSLRQWLDERQELEDKESARNPKKLAEATKAKGEEKEVDEAVALSLKKSFQVKRDKTKGFGGNVATTPKEF